MESDIKLRGEYRIIMPDGTLKLVENKITASGKLQIMNGAFSSGTFTGSLVNFAYIGLCDYYGNAFVLDVGIPGFNEPSVLHGYARQAITSWIVHRDATSIDNILYAETNAVVFTPAGGAFDTNATRMFVTNSPTLGLGFVQSISAPFQDTPLPIVAALHLTYRIYMQ